MGKKNKIRRIRDGREGVPFWNKVHCCCWGVKCVYSLCFQNNLPPQPHLLYTYQNLFSKNLPSHICAGWMDPHLFVPPLLISLRIQTSLTHLRTNTHTHTHIQRCTYVGLTIYICVFSVHPFVKKKMLRTCKCHRP